MNKNHELLINNLIPVLWHPGHMGAFFGRFLFDDIYVREYHELLPHQIKEFYIEDINFEWTWTDRIGNYFSYHNYDNSPLNTTVDILKKYYSGTDLDSAMIYITAQHHNDVYKNDIIKRALYANWKYTNTYNEDQLIHMANRDFDFDFINFEFPYIKSHVKPDIYRINMFNWKKKVLCNFPPEKNWIALFLIFYKHYWFYNQRTSFPLSIEDNFREVEGEQFRRTVKNKIYYERRPEFLKYSIDDYIIVDIYDLIFNKNLSYREIGRKYEVSLGEAEDYVHILYQTTSGKNHIKQIAEDVLSSKYDLNYTTGEGIKVEVYYFGTPKTSLRIVGVERTNMYTQVGVRMYYKGAKYEGIGESDVEIRAVMIELVEGTLPFNKTVVASAIKKAMETCVNTMP